MYHIHFTDTVRIEWIGDKCMKVLHYNLVSKGGQSEIAIYRYDEVIHQRNF